MEIFWAVILMGVGLDEYEWVNRDKVLRGGKRDRTWVLFSQTSQGQIRSRLQEK
jgi:hypothetical protein